MATYLADRVIVFEGTPSSYATAHGPQSLLNGMNRFLELLGITFRRDPNNFRPRINKHSSVKVVLCFDLFCAISGKLNRRVTWCVLYDFVPPRPFLLWSTWKSKSLDKFIAIAKALTTLPASVCRKLQFRVIQQRELTIHNSYLAECHRLYRHFRSGDNETKRLWL